jgi:hypothetical protein
MRASNSGQRWQTKRKYSVVLMAACLWLVAPASDGQSIPKHIVARGSRPSIATAGGRRLYAAFEAPAAGTKIADIYYTVSTDQGVTWSEQKNISMTPGLSQHPHIEVEKSGAIDIIWADTSSDPKSPDIFFVRSTDAGKSWTKPIDISSTPGASSDPAIALGPDDAIHVVWSDTTKGEKNRDIFYMCSRDGGKVWSPAVDLSNTPGAADEPTVAVGDDGDVHVAWSDTTSGETKPDIHYSRCTKEIWTPVVDVTRSTRKSSHPTLTCNKGKVLLAWADNSKKPNAADIWLDSAAKGGEFANPINISNSPGMAAEPILAASEGELAIVWSDTTAGTKDQSIFARASLDNGTDFSAVLNVSHTKAFNRHPDVAITKGRMYAIWEEGDITNEESSLTVSSVDLKGLTTSPAPKADPSLHGPGSSPKKH